MYKVNMWVFSKIVVKNPKWMVKIIENPIKMGWFGGPTPIFGNTHVDHPVSCRLHQPPWSRSCWLGSSPRPPQGPWILWVYQDQPVEVVKFPVISKDFLRIFQARYIWWSFMIIDDSCLMSDVSIVSYSIGILWCSRNFCQHNAAGFISFGCTSKPVAPWHHDASPDIAILGAKVPTQLHSLEEVASFTKKKIVDFKLRWIRRIQWMIHPLTYSGKQFHTVPALQFWDSAKVPLVDLTWLNCCQSLMKSAIFRAQNIDDLTHHIRQHKMVSHQVHCKDLSRTAKPRNGRFRTKNTKKKTKDSWCFPTFMRTQPTWHVQHLSARGVEGELPSIKRCDVISIDCGTTLHFKFHLQRTSSNLFQLFDKRMPTVPHTTTVIFFFFFRSALGIIWDVGMKEVSEYVSISSGQCFLPASENLSGSNEVRHLTATRSWPGNPSTQRMVHSSALHPVVRRHQRQS